MTNREAIEQLKFLKKVDFHVDTKESCDIAISVLEENDKLKAEIKRLNGKWRMYQEMADSFSNSNLTLKAEIEQWQSTNLKLVCELTRIECENHQLEVYKKKAQYALSCSVNAKKLMDSLEVSE